MADSKTSQSYSTPQGVFQGTPPIDYPKTPGFAPKTPCPVGGVILADGDITYNANRRTAKVVVHNTGDRPVQVGSHFHFFEVNRYLQFDRAAAFGKHLNIPATTAIRFEPGEEKEVELVAFGGKRRVIGFNDLTDGYTGLEDTPTYYPVRIRALKKMALMGFKSVSESEAESEVNEAELSAKAKGGK